MKIIVFINRTFDNDSIEVTDNYLIFYFKSVDSYKSFRTTREFISFKTLNIKNPLKNGYFFVKFHPFILRNLW